MASKGVNNMGLQKHATQHLEDEGFVPWGKVTFDMTVNPPAARFRSGADRDKAYKLLQKGGYFNPKKSGKKTIRFMPMPKWR